MQKKDFLSLLFLESKAYSRVDELEKLVENSKDLTAIPIQPLYLSLKNLNLDQVAQALPSLSSEQRQALLDLDTWNKDQIDVKQAEYWLTVYAKCPDQKIVLDYVKSEEFALLTKARFNIATFDEEDPQYPEHDHFFVSEDNLLLFEFDEDFSYLNEFKHLVKLLYSELGVEAAYSHLFKIVSDSFMVMEEESFRFKTERLRDYGFVDYHSSLVLRSSFQKIELINSYIEQKKSNTGDLDLSAKNQVLHAQSLVPFQTEMDNIHQELLKLKDKKRSDFLQFNFIRLVNASLALSQALKEGSLVINRAGNQTKQAIELGFNYIKEFAQTKSELKSRFADEGIFNYFDFFDCYKIGFSLIHLEQKDLKLALSKTPFEKEEFEYFLGATLNDVIDSALSEICKVRIQGINTSVQSIKEFQILKGQIQFVKGILPFCQKFFSTISFLKEKSQINDHFYLNYEVENIDLEAILISSFINYTLGAYVKNDVNKMGLTIFELKKFITQYFIIENDLHVLPSQNGVELKNKARDFVKAFGMDSALGIEEYIQTILDEHLSGYNFDSLSTEEFKHVGGPILLNSTAN